MNVTFLLKPSIRPRDVDAETGAPKLVEYVSIHTGHNGQDVVERLATQADRDAYRSEYASFLDGVDALREAFHGLLPAETAAAIAKRHPPVAPKSPPSAFEELVLEELP